MVTHFLNWNLGLCSSVMITDGHPDCVKNQNMCIQMNEQALEDVNKTNKNSPNITLLNENYLRCTCDVSTSLLRWSVGDTHNDIQNLKRKKFGVIIAADCLFFEDFHDSLIWILKNLLEKKGFCFFLQPKRGKSMENFIFKIKLNSDILVVSVSDNYNDEVNPRLQEYSSFLFLVFRFVSFYFILFYFILFYFFYSLINSFFPPSLFHHDF